MEDDCFRTQKRLGINAERLSGTPLVLHLIAVALESDSTIEPYETDPLNRILLGVCKREMNRQRLLIDEKKQMEIFEELFRNNVRVIQEEDIQLCLQVYGEEELEKDETQMSRFRHHFFFIRDENGDCVPRYEVLRTYFISRFLAHGLFDARTK